MRLAKSILCGAVAAGFTAGSAQAMDGSTASIDEASLIADAAFDAQVAWSASLPADTAYLLGRSDTLAATQSDTEPENPYGD